MSRRPCKATSWKAATTWAATRRPEEPTRPYDAIAELPKNVRNPLPEGAQKIFKEAFNDAWERYKDPDDRKGDASREEAANKVAWSAVKKSYEKHGDDWVKKGLGP